MTRDDQAVRLIKVSEFSESLIHLPTVFFTEEGDPLRTLLSRQDLSSAKTVLDIGTGTGILGLIALKHGAGRVVATDINPEAIRNARLNAERLGYSADNFEARLVAPEKPQAFSVIEPEEKFDLILSNPPWKEGPVKSIEDYGQYDPNRVLLGSLMRGLKAHLSPAGRAWLFLGREETINLALELSSEEALNTRLLDDKTLDPLNRRVVILEITHPQHVILISLDALRADHLSCYGYERKTSPHIDHLAEDSLLFKRAHATSYYTLPSHASLFTGLELNSHGVSTASPLAGTIPTLSETLRSRGFRTGAYVADIPWFSPGYGLDRGFDTFEQIPVHAEDQINRAIRWIGKNRNSDYFLFLHIFDIHSDTDVLPYDAPEPFAGMWSTSPDPSLRARWESLSQSPSEYLWELSWSEDTLPPEQIQFLRDSYDEGIAYVDHELGRLISFLKSERLYEGTWIFLHSDHGEELGDHGKFFHIQTYEEVLRVPLILKPASGRLPPAHLSEPVSLVDIFPTLLELLGVPLAKPVDGRTLVPLMLGRPWTSSPVYAIRSIGGEYVAWIGPWKGIYESWRNKLKTLYNLDLDPQERRNRLHDAPENQIRLFDETFRSFSSRLPDDRSIILSVDGPQAERESLIITLTSPGVLDFGPLPPFIQTDISAVPNGFQYKPTKFLALLRIKVTPEEAPIQLDVNREGIRAEPGIVYFGSPLSHPQSLPFEFQMKDVGSVDVERNLIGQTQARIILHSLKKAEALTRK
ncbi:MAG: sulfatase-like hydrolase/transferase [Candidatus Omnitrophica bacterium]|nr:sulfatase-like hydrolase/transferase [Candidatus Omnitrophota bacterium]